MKASARIQAVFITFLNLNEELSEPRVSSDDFGIIATFVIVTAEMISAISLTTSRTLSLRYHKVNVLAVWPIIEPQEITKLF